jgi:hypothetical protein
MTSPEETDDDMISEEEYHQRLAVLGLVAIAVQAHMQPYLYEGHVEEEDVDDHIDEQIALLESLETFFLFQHVLLTLPDDQFYLA